MPKVRITDKKGLFQEAGSGITIDSAQIHGVQARTATAAGDGTGVIAAAPRMVVVTSGAAARIVTLPAPVVGTRLTIAVTANGCELRTSAPGSISLNGVSGANTELALAAHDVVECICTSSTSWVALRGATATPDT